MTEKRFTVEKLELVSDHLSTRFFIKDNEEDKYYDVQHIVSEGFEVQYGSWADKIAEKMNKLHEENEQLKCEVYSYKCSTETDKELIEDLHKEYKGLEKKHEELKQSNKDAWNLIQFIYKEIKEEGSMDWGRIQDLVEF